ncbi:MAG TPA: hypothetical protein VF182_20415 [Candidatus Binatia bacterium]
MAKYRARICPNCRYFLGFSITKMPENDKEVGVISFCLNCSYRLPVHTVLNGFRRATAKLRQNRLKLASSFTVERAADSGHDQTSQRAAGNSSIISPESYSRQLRAIGQDLQQQGIDSFNLQCSGDHYAVWTRANTVTWPNRSLFNFSNRLENWWGLRNHVPYGYQSRAPVGHARFEYSQDDLARMDVAARIHRHPTSGFANGHSLSQLLRTIGSLAYQRNHRLLAISWRDISICVVIETAQGKREIEVFRPDNLYDIWVRMYLRRESRALSDVPQ